MSTLLPCAETLSYVKYQISKTNLLILFLVEDTVRKYSLLDIAFNEMFYSFGTPAGEQNA